MQKKRVRKKKIPKNYIRGDRPVIVAVTCRYCQALIITQHINTRQCEVCDKPPRLLNKASDSERYLLAKKHNKDLYPQLARDKKIERLGTYSTAGKYEQYPTNRMARKLDGTPDFEMERKLVKHLKKKTLSPRYFRLTFIPTEGDVIRDAKLLMYYDD